MVKPRFTMVVLLIEDLPRSLAFYRDLLGLEVVSDRTVREASVLAVTGATVDAIRVCMLRVPGADAYLELLQYDAVRPDGLGRNADDADGPRRRLRLHLHVSDERDRACRELDGTIQAG